MKHRLDDTSAARLSVLLQSLNIKRTADHRLRIILPVIIMLFTASASSCAGKSAHTVTINKFPGNFNCFKITASSGAVIITDPYMMNEKTRADIVVISHDHYDHNDFSKISGSYRKADTAGSFKVKDISITGYPGRHDKGDSEVTNIMYVLRFDGIAIAEFGSQCEIPSKRVLDEMGRIDILIIRPGMPFDDIVRIADHTGAKIIIPVHGRIHYFEKQASMMNADCVYNPDGTYRFSEESIGRIKRKMILSLDSGDDAETLM